jgi:hypothetical protein
MERFIGATPYVISTDAPKGFCVNPNAKKAAAGFALADKDLYIKMRHKGTASPEPAFVASIEAASSKLCWPMSPAMNMPRQTDLL